MSQYSADSDGKKDHESTQNDDIDHVDILTKEIFFLKLQMQEYKSELFKLRQEKSVLQFHVDKSYDNELQIVSQKKQMVSVMSAANLSVEDLNAKCLRLQRQNLIFKQKLQNVMDENKEIPKLTLQNQKLSDAYQNTLDQYNVATKNISKLKNRIFQISLHQENSKQRIVELELEVTKWKNDANDYKDQADEKWQERRRTVKSGVPWHVNYRSNNPSARSINHMSNRTLVSSQGTPTGLQLNRMMSDEFTNTDSVRSSGVTFVHRQDTIGRNSLVFAQSLVSAPDQYQFNTEYELEMLEKDFEDKTANMLSLHEQEMDGLSADYENDKKQCVLSLNEEFEKTIHDMTVEWDREKCQFIEKCKKEKMDLERKFVDRINEMISKHRILENEWKNDQIVSKNGGNDTNDNNEYKLENEKLKLGNQEMRSKWEQMKQENEKFKAENAKVMNEKKEIELQYDTLLSQSEPNCTIFGWKLS